MGMFPHYIPAMSLRAWELNKSWQKIQGDAPVTASTASTTTIKPKEVEVDVNCRLICPLQKFNFYFITFSHYLYIRVYNSFMYTTLFALIPCNIQPLELLTICKFVKLCKRSPEISWLIISPPLSSHFSGKVMVYNINLLQNSVRFNFIF